MWRYCCYIFIAVSSISLCLLFSVCFGYILRLLIWTPYIFGVENWAWKFGCANVCFAERITHVCSISNVMSVRFVWNYASRTFGTKHKCVSRSKIQANFSLSPLFNAFQINCTCFFFHSLRKSFTLLGMKNKTSLYFGCVRKYMARNVWCSHVLVLVSKHAPNRIHTYLFRWKETRTRMQRKLCMLSGSPMKNPLKRIQNAVRTKSNMIVYTLGDARWMKNASKKIPIHTQEIGVSVRGCAPIPAQTKDEISFLYSLREKKTWAKK